MPPGSSEVLRPDQVRAWRESGFLAIHPHSSSLTATHDSGVSTTTTSANAPPQGHLLTSEEVREFRNAVHGPAATPGDALGKGAHVRNFGGVGFPFLEERYHILNKLALHPRIVQAAQELLGEERLLLSQAEAWLKRDQSDDEPNNPYANADQRMHMDFPNHSLVHPTPWSSPEAVAMIVYLDSRADCGGPTMLVPRLGDDDPAYAYPYSRMPGFGNLPWINNRTMAEADISVRDPEAHAFRQSLYEREVPVDYRVGTILLYRLDLWHRGSPMSAGAPPRAVVNLLFKTREAGFRITSWHKGWATNSYNSWASPRPLPPRVGAFEHLLASLTRSQRELLGFPLEADAYWTPASKAAVQQRYPKMSGL